MTYIIKIKVLEMEFTFTSFVAYLEWIGFELYIVDSYLEWIGLEIYIVDSYLEWIGVELYIFVID